jgi:hypothetical protein
LWRSPSNHPTQVSFKRRSLAVGGAAWRVYEFVCRNFIGSLHQDLEFTRTVVTCQIAGADVKEEFELDLVNVDNVGYAAAMPWALRDIGATSSRIDNEMLKEGDSLRVTRATVEERKQRPPKFLQEYELIREMDTKGIGTGKAVDNCTQYMRHDDVKSTQTCYLIIPPSYAHLDASMAVHVSNIVDREYVVMCDETGTPLRPPLPPGKRKQSLPRQVGSAYTTRLESVGIIWS